MTKDKAIKELIESEGVEIRDINAPLPNEGYN